MQTPAPDGGKYYAELIRYNEWMMGFVTGFNVSHEDSTDDQINVDMPSLDVWIRKWCNDNPTRLSARRRGPSVTKWPHDADVAYSLR
jgi:hypothetical protein